MDDKEKKLFAQLDDPMAGQRSGALELLHLYDEKNGTSFRDRLAKIERGEKYDELEQERRRCGRSWPKSFRRARRWKPTWRSTRGQSRNGRGPVTLQSARLVTANANRLGPHDGAELAAYIGVPLIAIGT